MGTDSQGPSPFFPHRTARGNECLEKLRNHIFVLGVILASTNVHCVLLSSKAQRRGKVLSLSLRSMFG